MEKTNDWFGYDSMAFFGRVNASISHELKNVMAIISETAGLLGDLSDMASSGTPVSPGMLKDCTGSIIEEIQRGFFVIRQMNRFSHSIDNPLASVNLLDVLDLAINLSGYLSYSGKTTRYCAEGVTPTVQSCPFLLQAMVYQTLADMFKNTGPAAAVSISIQPHNGLAWRIIFSGVNAGACQTFSDPVIKSMAASIGVAVHSDATADRLVLEIPSTIESGPVKDITPDGQGMGDA